MKKNQKPMNRTFTNRFNKQKVELSKSEIRRIRKDVASGKINKLELPYEAEDINRIFAWESHISDSDLGKPAKSEVTEVPVQTKLVETKPKVTAKPKVKMNYEIANDIRNGKYGEKAKDIASALGIGESTARDILKGRTWKEVEA